MKTRDNRWRQFTAGHKETLHGGAESFFLGSFSAALLYSVAPVYRIMHQHQNFASLLHLHSVHDKIFLINNSICCDRYFQFSIWLPLFHLFYTWSTWKKCTLMNGDLHLTTADPYRNNKHVKGTSVVWVAKQQKAIERNPRLRKTDFPPPISKYYLKSKPVFSGGKKSTQQQET